MRTLSPDNPLEPYGEYNTQAIVTAIEKFTLSKEERTISAQAVSETESCEEQEYIMLESTYGENKIEVSKKEKFRGCSMGQLTGQISYKISSASNTLSEGAFNPINAYTDKPQEDNPYLEGETYAYDDLFYLTFPKTENQQNVNFFNEEGEN